MLPHRLLCGIRLWIVMRPLLTVTMEMDQVWAVVSFFMLQIVRTMVVPSKEDITYLTTLSLIILHHLKMEMAREGE